MWSALLRSAVLLLTFVIAQGCATADPPAYQNQNAAGFENELNNIGYQLNSMRAELSDLQARVRDIGQKTNNICFQDQNGATVIRPCNGE